MGEFDYPKNIVGIIPAAGQGSRLAPFPCPKELFPIGYQDYRIGAKIQRRPKVVSQYLIENIVNAGAKKVFIVLGEDKHSIMKYYGDGNRFGTNIAYLFQENLYGMPYALNLLRHWIQNDIIIFGMPDTIVEPKSAFQRMLATHRATKADLTLGLFLTDRPEKFGMVELDEEDNVVYIIDKPIKTDLNYMWGGACWSPSFTKLLDDFVKTHPYSGKETVLGDVFLEAIKNKLVVKGVRFDDGQYIDIGTADELDVALQKFQL